MAGLLTGTAIRDRWIHTGNVLHVAGKTFVSIMEHDFVFSVSHLGFFLPSLSHSLSMPGLF